MHTAGVPMARGGCGSIAGNGVGLGTVATSSWSHSNSHSVLSVGAPSECRDASASLTCGTDISGTRNRFDSPFGFIQRRLVNDALLTRHSDGAPTEHRMADTMAPGASSDCTKAYPIASDAPTTSPSRGSVPTLEQIFSLMRSNTWPKRGVRTF